MYIHKKSKSIISIIYIYRSDVERDEWIASIRNLCRTNANLSDKYHPTIAISASRWLCCGESTVSSKSSSSHLSNSFGCQQITWTPRQSKCDPVPPLPQLEIRSSPMVNSSNLASSAALHASSQQDIDDEDEIDSFDMTPELQHVGLQGDKNNISQTANNNLVPGFLDASGTVAQQQVGLGNLNHVSTPTSPATANNAAAAGAPVVAGTVAAAGGNTTGTAGTGKTVVAVYPFTAIEEGDLTLTKGREN